MHTPRLNERRGRRAVRQTTMAGLLITGIAAAGDSRSSAEIQRDPAFIRQCEACFRQEPDIRELTRLAEKLARRNMSAKSRDRHARLRALCPELSFSVGENEKAVGRTRVFTRNSATGAYLDHVFLDDDLSAADQWDVKLSWDIGRIVFGEPDALSASEGRLRESQMRLIRGTLNDAYFARRDALVRCLTEQARHRHPGLADLNNLRRRAAILDVFTDDWFSAHLGYKLEELFPDLAIDDHREEK